MVSTRIREIQLLSVDVLDGHIVSIIKPVYEDLEYVNDRNVHVRKGDQTFKIVCKVREIYVFLDSFQKVSEV